MAAHPPAGDLKPLWTLGYWHTLEEAQKEVEEYETRTGSRFACLKEDPTFGHSSWSVEECRVQWEEGEKFQGSRLGFDGVPFLVLATQQLACQYGMHKKELYSQSNTSRKPICPAKIVLKEVIKFPDYRIETNTNYEKKKWSKMIREDLCRGIAQTQRRIYVHLPPSDAHHHTVLVKKVQEPKAGSGLSVPHCLICNGKLSTSTRSAIPLFSREVVTSHRQLELSVVLGDILDQQLQRATAHSSIVCSKCFNLIDDIDSLEEQVINKKQVVVNRYKRTVSEVTQTPPSPGTADSEEEDPCADPDQLSGKRSRGRGRPPGRSRGRGRGRGRPRGRPKVVSPEKTPEKCLVKLELEEAPEEPFFRSLKSPPPLKTIKKEDIMSDLECPEDPQEGLVRMEALGVEEGVSEIPIVEGDVAMELQGDVLEVVEEVLEEEEKQGKRFSCAHCHKQFLTKAAVRNHVKVHDRLDSYECEECEKSFSTKYRLKAHLKIHVDRDRPHSCRVCNKSFYTRYHLNTHLRSHEGVRNFVCELCGKALSTQKTLELHILTHTGEKPFQCEICGSTFRQRSNLLTHIKATHYHEKNYHCHLCQKSFVRKRLLVYHMNSVHTGQRPYKCEVCSATFVYPHYFKRHLRKHTGDKPHKCHVCDKSFASRENRNAHMFIHTEKKPYECKMCNAGFMRKPLCVAHMSLHGQMENPEAFITFNSPSLLANSHEELATADEEAAQAIHAVRLAEEAASSSETVEEQTQIMRDGKVVKVTSRPVHIIETDETTRYVISQRVRDENMDHFFAALQGQVVEVRSEDF